MACLREHGDWDLSLGQGCACVGAREKPVYKNIYKHVYWYIYGLTRRGHVTANLVATRSSEYVTGMVQHRYALHRFCDKTQLAQVPTFAAVMTSSRNHLKSFGS